MKRLKHKRFKKHIHLIRYAVRRAIRRIDILEPEIHAEKLASRMKESNWLQWAQQKLGRMR